MTYYSYATINYYCKRAFWQILKSEIKLVNRTGNYKLNISETAILTTICFTSVLSLLTDDAVIKICPACNESPQNTKLIFACTVEPTYLTALFLWSDQVEISGFLYLPLAFHDYIWFFVCITTTTTTDASKYIFWTYVYIYFDIVNDLLW